MDKRMARIISICILIAVILVIFISVTSHIQPSYTITMPYSPTTTAFSATAPYGSQSVVYSNGSALATYNYVTHRTTLLSTGVGLSASTVDSMSVSSNDKFILFHDELVTVNGALYQQLQNQELSPQADYWWIYNVVKHSFNVLPQTTLLARMNHNTIEALTDSGGEESLTSYNPQTLAIGNPVSIPSINGFFPLGSGYLLQTSDNQILLTTNGIVSTSVAKNATLVGATVNGQEVVAVMGFGNSRELVVIDMQTQKQQVVATNIVGQPAWSTSGNVLYTVNDNSNPEATTLYSYNLTSHKTWLWKFSGSAASFNTSHISTASFYGDDTAIISTNSNTYYLMQPQGNQ
jgi:hypothetical protein